VLELKRSIFHKRFEKESSCAEQTNTTSVQTLLSMNRAVWEYIFSSKGH